VVPVRAGPAPAAPEDVEPALPPASPEERALSERLRTTVTHLAVDIGERNMEHSWNLASATDDLAIALEKMGYEVRRQGFTVGDDVVQNLEAAAGGGRHGDEVVVVGAHFDTAPGTPGADDDASGAAAVLELARAFHGRKTSRKILFALFVNEEPPRFQTADMGSLHYAKELVGRGAHVTAMLSLESLGAYSTKRGSQTCPKGVKRPCPERGDFVAVVGNEASRELVLRVTDSLKRNASLPVVGEALSPDVPDAAASDHWAFWQVGLPALMVTDTAPYRYPKYHAAGDLPAELDFDRMARAVLGLEKTVADLAGTDDEER
jgi:Zn-dependent M28 family amino/carboxypeptidase